MGAYLAKKIGSKKKVEWVSSEESQMIPANADKVAGGNNDATVDSSHRILKDTISCQISPAKNDEIEAARITMEAYSAKKSAERGTRSPTTVCSLLEQTKDLLSVINDSKKFRRNRNEPYTKKRSISIKSIPEMIPIVQDAVATFPMACHMDPITTVAESLAAALKDTTSNQSSPAKDDKIEAARKRMEAFLAKKQENGSVGRRILTVSAVPLIARQANKKTPEKKNEEFSVSSVKAADKSNLTATRKNEPQVPKASLAEQTERTDSNKAATSQCKEISPAKADELAEAKKRMDAFLANKQNGKPLTRTITASSATNNLPKRSMQSTARSPLIVKTGPISLVRFPTVHQVQCLVMAVSQQAQQQKRLDFSGASKRTTSDELNRSQQYADISITTDDISSIIFESNSNNQTSSERPQVVTGFTAPLSTASLFRDELNSEAPCSSVNTSILQVPEMRGESAGASSTISSSCQLDTSPSTADNVESRFRSAILSQTSPSKK
ncbi:unnamed protein product [Caenorhabditis brenneri]